MNFRRMRRNMRAQFYKKHKEHAQAIVPTFVKLPLQSTLFAKINVRFAIREAAKRKRQLLILYTRISPPIGSEEIYQVSPVSFRYRKLKVGYRKVLYAWDEETLPHQRKTKKSKHGRMKSFVLNNINNSDITDKKYSLWCRYHIEIL